jgi:hypothetical protein
MPDSAYLIRVKRLVLTEGELSAVAYTTTQQAQTPAQVLEPCSGREQTSPLGVWNIDPS